MYGARERVEPNAFHMLHARIHRSHAPLHSIHAPFHHGEAAQDGAGLLRGLVLQGHEIGADLAHSSLELADLDPTARDIGLELLDLSLHVVHVLPETVDVASQEGGIGAQLADARFELGDARLQLLDIGPQQGHIEIDAARDGVVVLELAADVFIFAVAAVDVAILGQDGGMQIQDAGVELVDAVVDVQKGWIRHSRGRDVSMDGQPGAGHRHGGPREAFFERGGHGDGEVDGGRWMTRTWSVSRQ